MAKKMRKEATEQMKFQHASLIVMIGTVFEERNYGVVLEYMVFGSLNNFMRRITAANGGLLPWPRFNVVLASKDFFQSVYMYLKGVTKRVIGKYSYNKLL